MSKGLNISNLTAKQEKFCQEYIKTGNKSEAYRNSYNASNMKHETVNVKACELMNDGKVAVRVQELQKEAAERNKIDIDECISILASIARFDISKLYNEDGGLKSIHDIDRESRIAISNIESEELFIQSDGGKIPIGIVRKIKTLSKEGSIDKLLKHLGGYEKHNNQKQTVIDYSKLDPKTLIEIWNARTSDQS